MTIKVLAISGSLRKASFNTLALRAAAELAPEGVEVTLYDGLRDIPLYDDDLRAGSGYPAPVAAFRAAIKAADALLIASPEYNFSVSGVLKNAIDWASRAPDQPFNGKKAAVLTASNGALGGAFANHHLRQVLVYLNVFVLPGPEVMVGLSPTKFQDGRLADEPTREVVRRHMAALTAFAKG